MPEAQLPRWRRAVLAVVARRTSWATAYARRQLRLADEGLAAAEPLADAVDRAADAADAALADPAADPRDAGALRRLADRHAGLRRELYHLVRAAERRLDRTGAYRLVRAGLVTDPDTADAVSYVADQVRPALDRIDTEIAG